MISIEEEFGDYITNYWNRSLMYDLNNFDFQRFFIAYRNALERKLSLHGVLSFEKYVQYVNDYYEVSILKGFEHKCEHSDKVFSYEEIVESIFKPRYNYFRKTYKNNKNYKMLLKLYSDLIEFPKTEKENVLMMERCIHAQHNSGYIIGKIDIEKLRQDFEDKIDKLIIDDVWGIYTRNGFLNKLKTNKYKHFALIDINDMHCLNNKYGYEWVNTKIKNIFTIWLSEFENLDVIVGRYYYGDEIIIGMQSRNSLLSLKKQFMESGVGFKIISEADSLEMLQLNLQVV